MRIAVNITAERSYLGEDVMEKEVRFVLNESVVRSIDRKDVRLNLLNKLLEAVNYIGLGDAEGN